MAKSTAIDPPVRRNGPESPPPSVSENENSPTPKTAPATMGKGKFSPFDDMEALRKSNKAAFEGEKETAVVVTLGRQKKSYTLGSMSTKIFTFPPAFGRKAMTVARSTTSLATYGLWKTYKAGCAPSYWPPGLVPMGLSGCGPPPRAVRPASGTPALKKFTLSAKGNGYAYRPTTERRSTAITPQGNQFPIASGPT